MIRLSIRSLTSRPLRTVLTALAILLGVAMITGTYVLTDQIDNGFASIFDAAMKGTSVVVSPKTSFNATDGGQTSTLNAAVLSQIRGIPGVAKAAGTYATTGAAIVHAKAVQTGGAPTLLIGDPGQPFNASTTVSGHPPAARNEVSITRTWAAKENLKVGDTFAVAAPTGLQKVKVAGTFDWASSSLGGTVMIVGRTQDVQRWGGQPGKYTSIDIAATAGVTSQELANRARAALPAP